MNSHETDPVPWRTVFTLLVAGFFLLNVHFALSMLEPPADGTTAASVEAD